MEKLLIYIFILFFVLPNLNASSLQKFQEQIQKAKTIISEKSGGLASLTNGFSSKALSSVKQKALAHCASFNYARPV